MTDPRITVLETEIEAQREQLAETLDQLAHKLDIKAQARERTALVRHHGTQLRRRLMGAPAELPRTEVIVSAASLLLVAAGVLVWRRQR